MGYYLVVDDKSLTELDTALTGFCERLEAVIVCYSKVIDRVLAEGVMAGKTHDSLEVFKGYVGRLQSIVSGVGDRIHEITPAYISAIETADSYLYDAGVLGNTRDFSQTLYDQLQAYLEWVGGKAGSAFESWINGGIMDVFDFFGIHFLRRELQEDLTFLLDYNQETMLGLKSLFDTVHAVDAVFAVRYSAAAVILNQISTLIADMASVIDPKSSAAIPGAKLDKLGNSVSQAEQGYQHFLGATSNAAEATAEQIQAFLDAAGTYYTPGFDGFATAGSTFHAKYSGSGIGTQVLIGIFNFEEIDKTLLSQTIKQKIGEDITFEEYLYLKQMAATLDSLSEKKTKGQEYTKGLEETLKDLGKDIGYAKDGSKDVYEVLNSLRDKDGNLVLDGRTKEAKRLKKFTKNLKTAKKAVKYTAKTMDYLSVLFADYSQQQDILDSMADAAQGDPKAMAAVERLQRIYEDQFTVALNKAVDESGEIVYDVTMNAIEDALPALGIATKSIDIIGNATGVGPRYRSAYEAMQMESVTGQSQQLYNSAVSKLQKANPNDPNYQQLVDNVNNTFELHKKNMETMYNKMADSMTGTERSYYQYCAQQVKDLDLKNANTTQIMTFKEFSEQDLGRVNTEKINPAFGIPGYIDFAEGTSADTSSGNAAIGSFDNSCPVDGGSTGSLSGSGSGGGGGSAYGGSSGGSGSGGGRF